MISNLDFGRKSLVFGKASHNTNIYVFLFEKQINTNRLLLVCVLTKDQRPICPKSKLLTKLDFSHWSLVFGTQ